MNSVADSLSATVAVATNSLVKPFSVHQENNDSNVITVDTAIDTCIPSNQTYNFNASINSYSPSELDMASTTGTNDSSIFNRSQYKSHRHGVVDTLATMSNMESSTMPCEINHGNVVTLVQDRNGDYPRSQDNCNKEYSINDSASNDMEPSPSSSSSTSRDYKKLRPNSSRSRRDYKCNICNEVFSKSSLLKLHSLQHTGERAFKCPYPDCGWSFTTTYKLKRHIRGHTGEKPFMCTIDGCNKHFTTAYNLKTHQRSHFKTNTLQCTVDGCTASFQTLQKLKSHERKYHCNGSKAYKCDVNGCGKEFNGMNNLTLHSRSHSITKVHPCTFPGCSKQFTKASKLSIHMRSHTGERPFKCPEDVDQHMQIDSASSQYERIEPLVTDPESDGAARNDYRRFSASDFNPADVTALSEALDKDFDSDEDTQTTESQGQISCKNSNEIDHDGEFNETAVVTSGYNDEVSGFVMSDDSESSGVDHFANFQPVSSAPVIDHHVSTSSNLGVNEYADAAPTGYNVRTHGNFTTNGLHYHAVSDFTNNGSELHANDVSGKEYGQNTMMKSQSNADYCSRTSIIRSAINPNNYGEYIEVDMLSEPQPNDSVMQGSQEMTSEQMLQTLRPSCENLSFRSQSNHLSYATGDDTLNAFNSETDIANADEMLLLDEHRRRANAVSNDGNPEFNAVSAHYVCDSGSDVDERRFSTSTVNLRDLN
ncbi:Zinc finger X-linked protein ZXDA [Trichoplax sp. H2]|nr:Zinc finger X-linked protein ZXDA [Trichoplax sp. H2]|eukprot:RDD37376.1 Zinc finger X-linked protein ZXDA [Trichoplax sp. H2]